MLMASNNGVGMNVGFPDVCMTPAGPAVVPVPYPNLAMNMMASVFSLFVFITKRPGLNMGSVIPMTTGDEGGVAHPMIKGPGTYTMGSPKVFVEKLPGIHLTCPTKGNGVNNGLGMVAVPSIVNVFFSLATHGDGAAGGIGDDPHARALDLPAAVALAATLDEAALGVELLEGGIGVLHIGAFSLASPSRAWAALRELGARGMRGLVVDLWDCPGGDTDAALALAGDFVPRRTPLAVVRDADGDEALRRAVGEEPFDVPLAILVGPRTASAAEIFAGCLDFQGRATLFGQGTFGKGRAQRVLVAPDGGLRAASVAEVLLPDGTAIEGRGLEPAVFAGSRREALSAAHAALLLAAERTHR